MYFEKKIKGITKIFSYMTTSGNTPTASHSGTFLVQKAIAIIDKLRTFLEVPTFW
jgi:hypothetical protein